MNFDENQELINFKETLYDMYSSQKFVKTYTKEDVFANRPNEQHRFYEEFLKTHKTLKEGEKH